MAPSPTIKAAYLDTPQGQVHYYFCPAAARQHGLPVLLMHMSASAGRSFHAIMGRLADAGFACYAPDMPGFGASFDPPTDPPSIAWYAALYHAALSAQLPAFANGCHVIGHHSGAIIGMEMAGNPAYAGFVHSLTMVGASVMTAADCQEMAKTFLAPFNAPVASGEHLAKTWAYLQWEGLTADGDVADPQRLGLIHREVLDHVRAWKGRSQIYSCVWKYERIAAMDAIPASTKVLGLCARDDVLWPYYGNFTSMVSRQVHTAEIKGGNFGPDLDPDGITNAFLELMK